MLKPTKYLYFFAFIIVAGCADHPAPELGIVSKNIDGNNVNELQPCPSTSNCVSSFADPKSKHYIVPIKTFTDPVKAHEKIIAIMSKIKGMKITHSNPEYIRVEMHASFFPLVSDAEFLLNTPDMIHIRCASRIGYYDFGSNRTNMEMIRFRFHQNDY